MDYIKELNAIQPNSSYIPENCNNMKDFGIYTNRAIMDIYNEASLSFLSGQFAMFNSIVNESVINEGLREKVKVIKDKVIQAFKDIWGKIKGFFFKAVDFIRGLFIKVKKEVFSTATESEFNKAIDFFKNYKKDPIVFTNFSNKDEKNKEDKVDLFLSKSSFMSESDKLLNLYLQRAQSSFIQLKDWFTKAESIDGNSKNAWISGEVKEKEDIVRALKAVKTSQVYGYILFSNSDSISEDFGAEDMKAAIYDKLKGVSYGRVDIDSNNLYNFSNDIKHSVYSSDAQKWTSGMKSAYDANKKLINDAIKFADSGFYYNGEPDDMTREVNNQSVKMGFGLAFSPTFAIDYCNRCKDILTVLTSIESTMNNMIVSIYKNDVKLVCTILNKYWKLNKDHRQVEFNLQPA